MSLALPLLLFAVATVGLAFLVEPFVGWYFQWAWWAYVLFADALNHRLAGRSLLRSDPRRFAWLAAVSVVLWTLFEAVNLRLGNWYYVMDHPARAARWAGGVAAFATVLPGLFETEALLANLGWRRRFDVPRLRRSRGLEVTCVALGLGGLVLPLVWPDAFFPLVWVGFAFLLEPWNRRHASASFARELERGEAAPLVRWLLAGLVCGVLWETWNHAARVKWIYTVPGFDSPRLFEMPVAGFLGFPPFAVGCVVAVRALEAAAERLRARATRWWPALRLCAWSLATASTVAVFAAADSRTVDSFYAPVAELGVLPPDARSALAAAGLDSPERLLRALSGEAAIVSWAARTGIPAPHLRTHRERVALVMHRGLGQDRALELERLGIHTRGDLARWTPQGLAEALRRSGARGPSRFLERRVRVWLEGLEPVSVDP